MSSKATKKRCFNCNKKVGLMDYTCKCDKIFCIKCRYPEIHNCNFDHKTYEKNQLKENLPKVVGEKIIKL